ncbi:hypothetical protein [Jiella marina]|uniref:hypothetical protein n=1 Tax=Jiella sp. LLJ827 TaxID=2917712 RepID=UPI002101C5AF|nr:hypothetical protein [Jiella sp. LLJ827]MCQ0989690.1 hypothetical protein [Jiella sp. LLJ827]
MAKRTIDWIIVRDFKKREIGAIGFIGNKAAVIGSFYDYRDGNMDGQVSLGERIAAMISPFDLKRRAIVEVAMTARYDPNVLMRDTSFAQMAAHHYLSFAAGLINDGVYAVYFSRGVKSIAGAVAGRVAAGTIKQFLIRKGMEKAVREIYDEAMIPH